MVMTSSIESASTELAWAAGFFDGEGHTRCDARKRRPTSRTLDRVLAVSITQKRREVLDRFTNAVGTGKVYGPYTTARGDTFRYSANGVSAGAALDAIWPWLDTVKREQAIAAGYTHSRI